MPVSAALLNVSPLRPPSRGSRPLVALPASAGAALRPGAAHEHEPAAAHEAGPVWHAHSVPCVPSGELPQPAAQLPWSGPEQLGQAVLLLKLPPPPCVISIPHAPQGSPLLQLFPLLRSVVFRDHAAGRWATALIPL